MVTPMLSGITDNFNLKPALKGTYFGFQFDGFIKVPSDGIYTFYLKSNDGSRLFIDDTELIENDANHGAVEEPGSIGLKKGMHRIRVRYFQCGGGKALEVGWKAPGMARHEIRSAELFVH